MKGEISATPFFSFELDLETIGHLQTLAKSHYDAICRAAETGLLQCWQNRSRFGGKCTATFRELDLTLKICEQHALYSNTPLGAEMGLKISDYQSFVRLMLQRSQEVCKITVEVCEDDYKDS